MPLWSWGRADEPTSPNASEASNRTRIPVSRKSMHCMARGKTSLAQKPVNVVRLVEILGGVEPNRIDQPRRGEVRAIEIGAINYDPGEGRSAQSGAPQRRIGEIRILERCEFEVDAREIRVAQACPFEIAGF